MKRFLIMCASAVVMAAALASAGAAPASARTTCSRDVKVTYGTGSGGSWEQAAVIRACANGVRAYAEYTPPGAPRQGAWAKTGGFSYVSQPDADEMADIGYETGTTSGKVTFFCVYKCGSAHTTALIRRCSETEQFTADATALPGWAQDEWAANTCGYQTRGVALCQGGRGTHTYEGGWVAAHLLESRATCSPSLPKLIRGGLDVRVGPGNPYTRYWKWPTSHGHLPALLSAG